MVRHSSSRGRAGMRWYCTRSPLSTRFTKGMNGNSPSHTHGPPQRLADQFLRRGANQRAYSSFHGIIDRLRSITAMGSARAAG